MLPRHRRRFGAIGEEQRGRPRLLVRLVFALVILGIVWYLVTKLFSYFDHSIGRKTAATLTVRNADAVQVALQGSDWQRAESNLKVYAGDSVLTRGGGDATLSFFDGTRIRLDQGSEVSIEKSDKLLESTSSIDLVVKSGRVWVSTPTQAAFTGSIARTIETSNFTADVPAESAVLMSASLINAVRAAGLGVKATLTFASSDPVVYVGEGQYFSLTEDAKTAINGGKDPYAYRDPVTLDLLRDEFLVSSYSMPAGTGTTGEIAGSSSSAPTDTDAPLTLTSPENDAKITTKTITVSGKAGSKTAAILVNGQQITLKTDRSFSVDLSLATGDKTTVKVEAQDQQGISLSSITRTVQNSYKVNVEPVRIKSPVGSGETLTLDGTTEVEITGEAPAGTAAVMVNDYKLQLFKAGSKTWSYLASANLGNLTVGSNVFTVYAFDADGNRSPGRSITIVLKEGATVTPTTGTGSTASQPPLKQNPPLTPGTLSVDKPEAGTATTVSQNEVVIEGRTSADTNSISINGYTLALYQPGKTTWNYIASTELSTMKRGKNVYRVVSRNANGEILDILEYTVNYQPQ